MPDLRTNLQQFFNDPATRKLARFAPGAVLAGVSGLALGAGAVLPGFAESGVGIVVVGLAVNLTSALIQPILEAATEDDRAELIQHGLAQGDADVATLTAAALVQAGPDVALALPDAERDGLAGTLTRAMQDAGGPLEVIAQPYAAALRQEVDWAAVQAALANAPHVRQRIEVADGGHVARSPQHAEIARGTVEQTMSAGKNSVIEDSGQSVIGRSMAGTQRCPDCGAPVASGQPTCGMCGAKLASGT